MESYHIYLHVKCINSNIILIFQCTPCPLVKHTKWKHMYEKNIIIYWSISYDGGIRTSLAQTCVVLIHCHTLPYSHPIALCGYNFISSITLLDNVLPRFMFIMPQVLLDITCTCRNVLLTLFWSTVYHDYYTICRRCC